MFWLGLVQNFKVDSLLYFIKGKEICVKLLGEESLLSSMVENLSPKSPLPNISKMLSNTTFYAVSSETTNHVD